MKASSVIAFFLFAPLTCYSQSFSTKSYPVGAGPAQLIVADFNGDHIPDLATVNTNANTVSILINNGDGTFRPQLEFATGPAPVGLAAVDWNKDGKMDLAVVNSGADAAHSISILLGNGDGTFQPHHDIPGAPNSNSIAVGDFNHDGNPDIATSSNNPVNAVYVSLGNGHGGVVAQKVTTGFGATTTDPSANPFLLLKISWADYNRDGKDDLYYIECCGGVDIDFGAFGVLTGNGDGTFTDHLIDGQDFDLFNLSSMDINQDGLSDAIVSYRCVHDFCGGVVGRINNGDGTFNDIPGGFAGMEFEEDPDLGGGAAFDVDGDGLKDFVGVGVNFDNGNAPTTMTLIITRQNADGSFAGTFGTSPGGFSTVPINAPVGESLPPVVGDFNHDGKPDLAFLVNGGGNNVFVVLNTTAPSACTIRTTNHSVTVCHPSDGAVGLSPVHIVSHFTSSTPPSVSQIYLDNKLVFQVAGGNIDKKFPLAPGDHRLEVKSWTKGHPFHNDFFLSMPRSIPATVPPCSESTNFAINICSPGQKVSVDAPVHVVAAAKSTAPITTMQIYLDFKEVF
ncbi:MAG TPA: VCBS repeat-containing protein, partial [Candidatus Angelobacter sp.]|nr:VCBS repeat-containing protein [Candidatus Angelobacter sp.]